MRSAELEIELLLFWFCLHGEAYKQEHSDHPVNGAIIHTQLTAAACDGQPVAPGGSSLGAKTGLLSPCGDQMKVGAPTNAPTETPSPMTALVCSAHLRVMLERAASAGRRASPPSSNARLVAAAIC